MADASPFLKRMQELQSQRPATKQAPATKPSNIAPPDTAAEERSGSLLSLLARGPMTTAELFSNSGMPLNQYTDTLAALTDAGLIAVETSSGGERASLTELGKKAAAG